MARPLRINYPGALYHITARGNERKAIVRDDDDRKRFVQTVAQVVERYRIICYAWVLMDNHYHLLLETPDANLSRALRHLNGTYTQAYNQRNNRVGHLFQGRFKSILVEKESYLLELCRYIVLNPVRAGLVQHPRQWSWSSYRATAGEESVPSWLTSGWVLSQFNRKRKEALVAYRRFVGEGIKSGDDPWSDLKGQVFLGSDAFCEATKERVRYTEDREIPIEQKRPVRPTAQSVLDRVVGAYSVSVKDIVTFTRRPSEARQAAIYLVRRESGLDLTAVSKLFGIGYTAVSRRVGEMEKRMENEPGLRRRVGKLLMAR